MQGVLADIIHMMHRVLRGIHRDIEFRHYYGRNSGFIKIGPPLRIRGSQQFDNLHLDPLGTDLSEVLSVSLDCRAGLFLNIKIKLGGKAYCSENPQRILIESCVRIADTSDQFILKVRNTSVHVDKSGLLIVSHRIDREIPPQQVLLKVRGESNFRRMTSVLVLAVDPVCRHLKSLITQHNSDCSMGDSRVDCSSEKRLYFIRSRRSRDIPILRLPLENTVPHTSANYVRLISMCIEYI